MGGDGATAATLIRTMRRELPAGVRSISSLPHRHRDLRLVSASSTRRRIVLGDMLSTSAARGMVSSRGSVVISGLYCPVLPYSSAVQTVNA